MSERDELASRARLWLSQMAKRYRHEGQRTNGPRSLCVSDQDHKNATALVESLCAEIERLRASTPDGSDEREGLREAIAEVLAEALAVFIQHGVCDLQDPYDAKRFDEYLDKILDLLTQAQEPDLFEPYYIVVDADGDICTDYLVDYDTALAWIEGLVDGDESQRLRWSILPVGTSPVASAPELPDDLLDTQRRMRARGLCGAIVEGVGMSRVCVRERPCVEHPVSRASAPEEERHDHIDFPLSHFTALIPGAPEEREGSVPRTSIRFGGESDA